MPFVEGSRAYGAVQRVAVGASSAQSAVLNANEVLLHATVACYVVTGDSPTATAAAGLPLVAGEKLHIRLHDTHKVAVIRDSSDGFLYIAPCG